MARAMKTQKLDMVCKCAPDVEAHLFLGLELKNKKILVHVIRNTNENLNLDLRCK